MVLVNGIWYWLMVYGDGRRNEVRWVRLGVVRNGTESRVWIGRDCTGAVQVVLVGVVRSSHGDYAWYGSDVALSTGGDLCGLTYMV
jgi:hypothetical protein